MPDVRQRERAASVAAAKGSRPVNVRERLDRALRTYLDGLHDGGMVDISVEAIASLASVSRATAYRHFGDRDGLLLHAVVILTQQHASEIIRTLRDFSTAAAKIEEAFAYTARVVANDRKLQMLLEPPRPPVIQSALHDIVVEIYDAILPQGWADAQIRQDLSSEEITTWISQQQAIVLEMGLSEDETREWVRKFVLPTLRAHETPIASSELAQALTEIDRRMDGVHKAIEAARSSLIRDNE